MRYDPLGRLFEVTSGASTTRFLHDGADLIGEYNGAGTLQARFLHGVGGGDDPLIAYSGSGTANSALRQLYADRLGSIVLATTYTGGSPQRSAYDAWGIPDAMNAGVGAGGAGRFQYTGQAWLPELGLYHYKARAYSPLLGRFMQPDPIGYGDGMNMYAYVGNNPVNAVDPTGLADPAGGNGNYCILYPSNPVCNITVTGEREDGNACGSFGVMCFNARAFMDGADRQIFAAAPSPEALTAISAEIVVVAEKQKRQAKPVAKPQNDSPSTRMCTMQLDASKNSGV